MDLAEEETGGLGGFRHRVRMTKGVRHPSSRELA